MSEIKTSPLSPEEIERLRNSYPEILDLFNFIRTEKGGCFLPEEYVLYKDIIKNWEIHPTDVFVCGFPKTGTTWVQDLVWCIQNNCDFERCAKEFVYARARYLDGIFHFETFKKNWPPLLQGLVDITSVRSIPDPRVYKTHLPFCLLPDRLLDDGKAVLCLRNPKDALVSYFHHSKLFTFFHYTGDFATYFDLFMDNMLMFSPYFEYYVEAWKQRSNPNLCIVFYEDMKSDLAGELQRIAKFLGKTLKSEDLEKLTNGFSFKQLKKVASEHWNKALLLDEDGSFFRKGTVGNWKEHFTEEMNQRMDEKIEKYFKPIGLEFRYE